MPTKKTPKAVSFPLSGRFAKGNPGGGRPRGSRNVRTEIAEAVGGKAMLEKLEAGDATLPTAFLRWKKLLMDRSPGIRLAAERHLYEGLHGRAHQALEVASDSTIHIVNDAWHVRPNVSEETSE